MIHRSKILPLTALTLLILLILVIVLSWIVSSVNPSLPIRSMISGEGIRRLLGGFTSCLANPILVWILVCSIAWGTFVSSGLLKAVVCIFREVPITYRQRYALLVSGVLFVILCIIIFLLTFVPNAVLLGVTGDLFPSAFSSGGVPLIAFVVVVISLVYGISCGELNDIGQVFRSLYIGIKMSAPLWPLYIFIMQLYLAVMFVLSEN